MPGPDPFPCGGAGQKPCPPTPAAVVNGVSLYTLDQIHAYGQASYEKGLADAKETGA